LLKSHFAASRRIKKCQFGDIFFRCGETESPVVAHWLHIVDFGVSFVTVVTKVTGV